MSNNTTCHVEIAQGLGYGAVFLLGFLVNGAALRAFIAKRDSWTDTHIYMLNLVIADTALILFLPFRIYDAFYCLPTTTFCTFLLYVHFINMYASILTTTAISVQRYVAIRFPLQARSWRKKKETAVAVCLFFWALLLVLCVLFRDTNNPKKLWTCFERRKDQPFHAPLYVTLLLLGFVIPLVIIVFCSSQIISILLKDKEKSEEKKSIVGIVAANMIVFIVCYTPIHVGFLVNVLANVPSNWKEVYTPEHIFLLATEWIASTNCCFDSISYHFLLKQYYL